jgi:hypothetical protein
MYRPAMRVPSIAAAMLVATAGLGIGQTYANVQGAGNVGWVNPNNNLEGWRYSPISQINHPIIIGNTA